MPKNKQSVEEVLFGRAVEMTTQILYNKGFFDSYNNADEVWKISRLLKGVDQI